MPLPPSRRTLDPLLAQSEWRTKLILVWTSWDNQRTIPASCLRYVAVHRGFGPQEAMWNVTVISQGRMVVSVTSEEDARRVAKYLDAEVGAVLAEPVWETMMGRMPLWVRSWTEQVFHGKKWVDPMPYRRSKK